MFTEGTEQKTQSMRQAVTYALSELVANSRLGEYSVAEELAAAVDLVYTARREGGYKLGDPVSGFAHQLTMFQGEGATVADFRNVTALMLANILNDARVTQLKKVIALYNERAADAAAGVIDMFSGDRLTKEQIITEINNFLNNATKQDVQQAADHAVADRQKRAERASNEQSQISDGRNQEGQPVSTDQSGNRGATEQNTISQEDTRPRQEVTLSDPRTMSDEEKARRGDMLQNAPVVDVEKGTITATEKLSARKAAEQWWSENVPEPLYYATEAGEVEINQNSVESSLAHRYGQAKLDAITSLPEGFENAVYLGTMPDSRERGVLDHYFAYPINYDGKRCYVFCRAIQDNNKNRLYVHEVFIADNIKKGNTLQTAASKPHGGIALYRDILANVLNKNNDEQVSESESTEVKPTDQGNNAESSVNNSNKTEQTPTEGTKQNAETQKKTIAEIAEDIKKAKEKYPEYVFLARQGNTYVAIGEDANTINAILHLPLSKDGQITLTRIPADQVNNVLSGLIRAGKKVALKGDEVEERMAKGKSAPTTDAAPTHAQHLRQLAEQQRKVAAQVREATRGWTPERYAKEIDKKNAQLAALTKVPLYDKEGNLTAEGAKADLERAKLESEKDALINLRNEAKERE